MKKNSLQNKINQISEKYLMTDEERINQYIKNVVPSKMIISKDSLKKYFHNNHLEKKVFNMLIQNLKPLRIIHKDKKLLKIDWLENFHKDEIFIFSEELNEKIYYSNNTEEILLINFDCKNEIILEKSLQDLNKLLKNVELSNLTIEDFVQKLS